MLSVTEGGFGKRTNVDEYRTQGRGGKGIINVKTTAKNGKVVAIMRVQEDSDVLVMTANGKLIRVRSQDIRAVGRATQGVRLINLDDDDKVTAATLIEPEAKDEEDSSNGELVVGTVCDRAYSGPLSSCNQINSDRRQREAPASSSG